MKPVTIALIAGSMILGGIIGGIIVAIALAGGSKDTTHPATTTAVATKANEPPPYWRGGPPLTIDADKDGIDDLVGLRRYINNGDGMSLFALSGKDGHVVWETPSLGSYTEVYQSQLALVDGVVVRGDQLAHLFGYSAITGKPLWNRTMGEVVRGFCAGGDAKSDGNGSILVETADEKWWEVAVGTGETTAAPRKPDACGVIQKVQLDKVIGFEVREQRVEVPKMSVARILARGSAPDIAVGYRSPGTAVSMIAGVAANKVLWVAEVPLTDPLRAHQWSTDDVTLDDDHVAVLYEYDTGPPAVTVFARADGKRLWDLRLAPNAATSWNVSGIGFTRDLVVVALYGEIRALELATGKVRWTVGP